MVLPPLISVVVPCYNQAQYMDECLQSVLDQTYTNWECIIVNDGSPDHTEEIALKWTQKDHRFKYLKKENGGLSSARNTGIEVAKGEWILPLDSDDKIGNRYLELAQLEFNKGHTIIYCEAEFFGKKTGKWILNDFRLDEFSIRNLIFCSAFFRKKNWEAVGGYDENLKNGYEDWEFWISILKDSSDVFRLNEVLFYYRKKEESMTLELHQDSEKKKKALSYIYIKHINFFVSNLKIPYQILYMNYEKSESELVFYKGLLKSKRYRIIDFFFRFIDKILK